MEEKKMLKLFNHVPYRKLNLKLAFIFFLIFNILMIYFKHQSQNDAFQKIELNLYLYDRPNPNLTVSAPIVNKARIDRLFRILLDKEKVYGSFLDKLGVISFSQLIRSDLSNLKNFDKRALEYLQVIDGQLQATDKFVQDLKEVSRDYSFNSEHERALKPEARNMLDVIMVTGDKKYYKPLTEAIHNVKEHFKRTQIIIYDLGLTENMRKSIFEMCKSCELRLFDEGAKYSKMSPHVLNLNTYSFKPLIIQEILRDHNTVMYLDTSIRFQNTSLVNYWIERTRKVAFLSRFIKTNLPCYTDERMFEWFGSENQEYSNTRSLEANFFIFRKSLVLDIMLKAWVTCALDSTCIAPEGAHIYGSLKNWGLLGPDCSACGCHRFDQAAFAIISNHFYEHPIGSLYYPAFALNNHLLNATDFEGVFKVCRRDVKSYVKDQLANIFSY